MGITVFLLLATLLSTSHANFDDLNPIQLLRPLSGSGGHPSTGLDCLSWRLAVETNNLRNWKTVPRSCVPYVGNYMLHKQYSHDCELVADAAIEYAESTPIPRDGRNVWVFDISETALSNIPYYAREDVQFGGIRYNSTKFNEWVMEAKAPPVPATLRLYNKLSSLGYKIVFLSGSRERVRQARITNLHKAGYRNWKKLILKGENEAGAEFKSKKRTELVEAGFRIIGNVGDQWSDFLGSNPGRRTFKLPNPMYYVG